MIESLESPLTQWSELEPKRCWKEPRPHLFFLCLAGQSCQVTSSSPTWRSLSLLEYSLREAIEEKGWSWSSSSHDGHYLAVVCTDPNSQEAFSANASHPVLALLFAYLKALAAKPRGVKANACPN